MRYFPLRIENVDDINDLIEIKRAVMTWLHTKADFDPRYVEQKELVRQLGHDAWHSELLERLLQGKQPEKRTTK